MTHFGKFLVILNFVFALVFMTWSTVAYTQRIVWKDRLDALEEQINIRSQDRASSQARHTTELALLPAAEKERDEYKLWYPEQLEILRTGKDKDKKAVETPVRRLVRKPPGLLLDINDKNKDNVITILVAVDPAAAPPEKIEALRSLADYTDEMNKLQEEVKTNATQINTLVLKNKELTEEIAGVFKDKKLVKKGKRAELADEESYAKLFIDEMAALRPQLGARLIESDALRRRVEQLTARLKQLQDVGVAARP